MASRRYRLALFILVVVLTACTSATDHLNHGIQLQNQGRYFDAVYRYADAVEKDPELREARDRMLAVADSAVMYAMDDAAALEDRGEPVEAAGLYRRIDGMAARIRQVGERPRLPGDYATARRAVFDRAIDWQMARGAEAAEEGRWEIAQAQYRGARGDFLPSRRQVEAAEEAEIALLLDWASVELHDHRPRAAFERAQQALEVRGSPSRDTKMSVREIQDAALDVGTVVLAVVPVTADPGVREWVGGEFEIQLDQNLALDHWNRPPLFVQMADAAILRTELRGLLRGQATQSPFLVGRALDLVGADLAVMIRLNGIEVVEEGVRRDAHQTVVQRRQRQGARWTEVQDTVTYTTVSGTLSYYLEAEILLVDPSGREVNRFTASSRQKGPFERGEFEGDPGELRLAGPKARFFDPAIISTQMAGIERALLDDIAVAVATGTYDQVLLGIE